MKIKPINNWQEYEQAKRFFEHTKEKSNLSDDDKNTINVYKVLLEEFERKGKVNLQDVVLEPLIDQVWDSVCSISSLEQKGLIERGLKLGEEFGELSAEILKFTGYKNTTESESQIKENILLESTDCLIMVLDIMKKMDFTKEEICKMADKQINKWISNIKK